MKLGSGLGVGVLKEAGGGGAEAMGLHLAGRD